MLSSIGMIGSPSRAGRTWLVSIGLIEAVLLILGLVFSARQVRQADPAGGLGEAPDAAVNEAPAAVAASPAARNVLLAQLSAITAQTDGTYGIAVIDLDSGEIFGINQDTWFPAASTAKLQLLSQIYREVEAGRLSRQTLLAFTEADYEEGTGSIQNSAIGGYWTVAELTAKLIKESDNVAKNMLYRLLGAEQVNSFNLTQGVITDADNTYTTPRSMAVLLQLIYQQKLVGPEPTAEMLELMTGTDNENRLPRHLTGVRVAHKIGTVDSSVSDVGIVFLPGHPFAISIYSDGATDLEAAEATIAALAAQVYAYEAARPPGSTPLQ